MISVMLSMRCNHDDNTDDINFIIFSNIDVIDAINIINLIGYHGFYISIPSILFADIIYDIDDMI